MTEKQKIVVLGGGIGGLSAGYFLARTGKYEITVVEKASVIGGLCGSFELDDFTLDYGAHKIYSVIPGILDEISALMGNDLLKIHKKNRLFLRGNFVDYPLGLGNIARVLGPKTFLKIGFDYAFELLKGIFDKSELETYEDYMVKRFGKTAYALVFEPLADKVWGDPSTLHLEMALTRIPASGGLELVLKMLGLRGETADTDAEYFYYPRAGFGAFPQALADEITRLGGHVLTDVHVTSFEQEGNRITSVEAMAEGNLLSLESDYVVSSVPLPLLGILIFGNNHREFTNLVQGMQYRHVILVYIFIDRDLILKDQWIFFPEKHLVFSRIFEQKQMNHELGPHGRSVITADFTATEESELWQSSDDELAEYVITGLIDIGIVRREEVTRFHVKRQRNFYPRYDLEYREKIEAVSEKLSQVENLLTTGRIGMYNYNNSDHCMDMGRFIAEHLSQGEQPQLIWRALLERVAKYRIVD